jgi:uncharacterized membrane protein YozB (DUF420 family)
MSDPKTAYWTLAWLNLAAIVVMAWLGRWLARRKELQGHRRLMLGACTLVVLFVASYGLKLAFLGRETLATWEPHYRLALRVHELCVAGMLLGGALALWHAHSARLKPGAAAPVWRTPAQIAASRWWHRRAGLLAIVSATAAVVTAGYVLAGMYARLGAATP